MKILFFIPSLKLGGAERIASCLIDYLAGKGHELVLVNRVKGKDHYAVNERVRKIFIAPLIASRSPLGAIFKNRRVISDYRRIIEDEKPGIVLAFMNTTNIRVIKAARGLDVPVIISERNYPPNNPLGPIWERLRRKWYPKADNLVCISRGIFDFFHYLPNDKKTVIPNPVFSSETNVAGNNQEHEGRFRFLSVGRLHRVKNYPFLIKAFSRAAKKIPEWDLYIIGEGEERGDLEKLIDELGMENRVFLPGASSQVAEWYRGSDIFCLTSFTEGFGNVIVEAMHYGCPVISVDCPTGPGEIIEDADMGILLPQNDLTGFSKAMADLAVDCKRRNFLSRAGKKRAEEFSLDKIMPIWEELIQSYVN